MQSSASRTKTGSVKEKISEKGFIDNFKVFRAFKIVKLKKYRFLIRTFYTVLNESFNGVNERRFHHKVS